MPRPKNPVPTYRLHKPTGRAVCTVRLPGGGRRDVYLGRYDSPESKREYERVLAEIRGEHPHSVAAPPDRAADPTVNEVLLAFLRHADGYYVHPDGTPTSEVKYVRESVRVARRLYGHTPAREFGPLALKAVRQAMVDGGLARTTVNGRVNRVRRVFKWAASEELVPFAAYQALTAVRGRSAARETEPVRPVPREAVGRTLPQLNRHTRAMVELQLLTGMRPGEVTRMRGADLDTSGEVWEYRPPAHKTRYRGAVRTVFLGPKARAILSAFLGPDQEAYLFSPAAAREERYAELRAARKTKVQPSQRSRRKKCPARPPGSRYTTESYGRAVAGGVRKANAGRVRHPDGYGPNLPEVSHWHPNQLRHVYATEVRRRHWLEAAQVALGHSRADVTQVYAERDLALAVRVAAEVG